MTEAATKTRRPKARHDLPPVISREEAPGYLFFADLELWIYLEDALIAVEAMQELADPAFQGRRHGTRHLANVGCSGHLCRKAARDYIRKYDTSTLTPYKRKWERYDELFELLGHRHAQELEHAKKVAA